MDCSCLGTKGLSKFTENLFMGKRLNFILFHFQFLLSFIFYSSSIFRSFPDFTPTMNPHLKVKVFPRETASINRRFEFQN